MKRYRRQLVLCLLLVLIILLWRVLPADYLNFGYLKAQRKELLLFVENHYLQAVMAFIFLYIGTALFLPGALVLTVAGGMLFGTIPAMIYVNIGATAGALLAFLLARAVIGGWFQERFKGELRRFNSEVTMHGHYYLLMLRILPIVPFFVVNYCAGITKTPLRTFIWTTSLGVLPGSLIYTLTGHQLATVEAVADFFSWKTITILALLSLLPLLPVILHHLQPDVRK